MRNIKITVEYKGTQYFGWQKQDGKPTVQGELERALFSLTGKETEVFGSGRTDRGVHALGQVANFEIKNQIPLKNLKIALNDLLPSDIRVLKAEEESKNFNARFSAKRKTYEYLVQVGGQRRATKADLVGFYTFSVDLKKMQQAAKLFVGKHNFRGFCSADTTVTNFEREIFDLKISKQGRLFKFDVTGNGFLYNMVRIIVGTLLDVGRGKLTEESVKKALSTGERKYAGITMEPCGLYLKDVRYV